MKNLIIIFSLLAILFASCEKDSLTEEKNSPPEIKYVIADKTSVYPGEKVSLFCLAFDQDDNQLTYTWDDGGSGIFYSNGAPSTVWEAPLTNHGFTLRIIVFVKDKENTVSEGVSIKVMPKPEEPKPKISNYIRYVSDDAYVSKEYPDKNYGASPNLYTGPGNYSYLRFDIRDIFNYLDKNNLSTIQKVEIRLMKGYQNSIVKPVGTTEMYGLSLNGTSWLEELITFNTRPQYRNKITEVQNITFDVNGVVAFNVKEDFLNCVQLYNYYSVMLSTPHLSVSSNGYFYSKELKNLYPEYADAATPALYIEYKSN